MKTTAFAYNLSESPYTTISQEDLHPMCSFHTHSVLGSHWEEERGPFSPHEEQWEGLWHNMAATDTLLRAQCNKMEVKRQS